MGYYNSNSNTELIPELALTIVNTYTSYSCKCKIQEFQY